jgi:hypothetical protein
LDGNYKPTALSSSGVGHVVDGGIDLSLVFNTDYTGIPRPQGGGWDIGAYEYAPNGPATPTATPGIAATTPALTASPTLTPMTRELNQFQMLQIRPQPAQDQAVFYFSAPAATQVEIKISNLIGRLVSKVSGTVDANQAELIWNTKTIASGIYFYSVYADGHLIKNGKVSVQHN